VLWAVVITLPDRVLLPGLRLTRLSRLVAAALDV